MISSSLNTWVLINLQLYGFHKIQIIVEQWCGLSMKEVGLRNWSHKSQSKGEQVIKNIRICL